MPVQDDFVDMDKHDKHGLPKDRVSMPLWRNGWRAERTAKFRKCSQSGKTIWPFQEAFAQDTFWGLANAQSHEEMETEWMTSASYTYLKLAGKIIKP